MKKPKCLRIRAASIRAYDRGYRRGYKLAMKRGETTRMIMYDVVIIAQTFGQNNGEKFRRRAKVSPRFRWPHPLKADVAAWF